MTSTGTSIDFLRSILKEQNGKCLVVGICGPQGSGKSYLAHNIKQEFLKDHLRALVISIDDFYLTRTDQEKLQAQFPGDPLIQGRGLPGTHDVALLCGILDNLMSLGGEVAKSGQTPVKVPIYDKSALNGLGDRAPESEWQVVTTIPDVIILEGWFNGFASYNNKTILLDRWCESKQQLRGSHPIASSVPESAICMMDERLSSYAPIWERFDCFIYYQTDDLENIKSWRLQQEHALIARKGYGMTDAQVITFIDRYYPAYMLYYGNLTKSGSPAVSRHRNLRLVIDAHRYLIDYSRF